MEPVLQILQMARSVIEKTPPELVGDLLTNGIVLTGGGAKLHGLCDLTQKALKIEARLAEEPEQCVAIGTGKLFGFMDEMSDGIIESILYPYTK